MEEWKYIVGTDMKYEVSDLGNVRNAVTGKVRKTIVVNDGKHKISLKYAGTKYVHRMVAIAFIPNTDDKFRLLSAKIG